MKPLKEVRFWRTPVESLRPPLIYKRPNEQSAKLQVFSADADGVCRMKPPLAAPGQSAIKMHVIVDIYYNYNG